MKKIFTALFLTMLSLFSISIFAESNYLEAKDYSTLSLQEFLNECKSQNKNAFFNKNIYTLSSDLNVLDGVSILAEEGTIFASDGKQRYIFDAQNVKNITIENIIFDNVTIWCQRENSTGWTIKHNIFINARDLDVTMGCKPDSNGKNGGPATGYYIQNKRGSMQIISNMFLRNSSSLGRGVATYFTKDVLIKDNYFGRLEDVEGSIVSTKTKHLKEVALASGRVSPEDDYGFFMTGINILNTDINTKILGNYMSFNTDITEAGYEDGSQSTQGYNRDHFVYAKAFQNLEIVGNYFKGMNKNQDGGVKCRNGEGLLVYKNILEDSLLLLYVQDDATGAILKNVDIRENIFINKDYTSKLIKIPYGDNKELSKYLTVDYSILFLNYRADSDVDSITISSNLFYSKGLANEQIRIDNRDKTYNTPKNIYIENNKNVLGEYTRITTRNFKNEDNVDVRTDWNNGLEYQANLTEEYQLLDVRNLANIQEVSYEIKDGKLISSAAEAYIDGTLYSNQALTIGKKYFLFLLTPCTTSIVVEDGIEEGIPSFKYTALEIEIKEKGYDVSFINNGYGQAPMDIKDCTTLPELPELTEKGFSFLGWYLNEALTEEAVEGMTLTKNITLYAKWIRNIYRVDFITNSETSIPTQEIPFGSLLKEPVAPVKEGYIFRGWYLDPVFKNEFDFTAYIDSNLVLYAKWDRMTYTVTYDCQGHGVQPEAVNVESKLPLLLPELVEEGWKFGGWYTDISLEKKAIPGSELKEDITLYAKWTEITFLVYFADVDISPISVKMNDKIVKPQDPILQGYTFGGWYKEKECLNPWDFAVDQVTKTLTLFPKWIKLEEPTVPPVQIHFDSNGGSLVEDMTSIVGEKITKPKDPIKEGFIFEGWYKNSTFTEMWNFDTDVVSEDLVLYAKWNKEIVASPQNTSNMVTILSVSISVGVGVLGLLLLGGIVIRKKRSK